MTRSEFFETMPQCDVLYIDEFDEALLEFPYEFLLNSKTEFNGIWNLSNYQVIGLSATSQDSI
jgi:hypothetical protein